jgi:hypothetical protein
MDSTVNTLAKGKPGRNAHGATALDFNSNPSHPRGGGGGGESDEVTSKRGEVDRANGINYPKLREVTTMGEGRGEGYGAKGDTHLGVIVFIRALLEGGEAVRVIGGDIAQHNGVRRVIATRGAVLLDDHAFREGPPQESVIRGSA